MKRLPLLLLLLLLPSVARAQDLKDRFNVRVALTSMFLHEDDGVDNAINRQVPAYSLLYGDLRLQMDGRRLPGNFELHVDARVRVTSDIDQPTLENGSSGDTARGYLGGREYELRQFYFMRRGESTDFAIGRQFVLEADNMKIDGARIWYRFVKPHWDFSLFAGGYPNPYSRSLTTDYQGANGYYGTPVGGGADISYVYDKFWGSLAAAVTYLGGLDDGGPLNLTSMTLGYNPTTETPRSFLNWVGYERFASWLDLYHNLVVDMSGAGGAQLTRLNVFATARAGKHFTLQAGFDHMSAIAIEMYLTALLQNRGLLTMNGVTALPGITNNLIVERTAHEQARLYADAHWGLVNVWAEGRFRLRSLVNASEDPQFAATTAMGMPQDPNFAPYAGDATIGVRDRGTLKKLRFGLWYTFLDDYRSLSHILGFEMGRSFYDERLSIDLSFLYGKTTDNGAAQAAMMMNNTCNSAAAPHAFDAVCYGTRDGSNYEAGLTVAGNPSKHWFMYLDYRLVANTGNTQNAPAPTILTHMLLFRIEARY